VGSGVGTGGGVGSTGFGVVSTGAVEGGWGATLVVGGFLPEHPERHKTMRQVNKSAGRAADFILCILLFIICLLSYIFDSQIILT
jgi:hypothetical protein